MTGPAVSQRNQTVLARFNAGFSVSDVAESCGVSVGAVCAVLKRARNAGMHVRAGSRGPQVGAAIPGRRKVHGERDKALIHGWNQGLPLAEVARSLGISFELARVDVHRLRRKFGVDVVPYRKAPQVAA